MKRTRIFSAYMISAICALSFMACGKEGAKEEPQAEAAVTAEEPAEESGPQGEIMEAAEEPAAPAGTVGTCFDELVDELYEGTGGNTMLSPLSLDMALTLLREGAGEGTDSAEALDLYLGGGYRSFASDYMTNQVPVFDIGGEGYEEALDEIVEYQDVLEIANSAWVSDRYELSEEYRENVSSKYQAQLGSFDAGAPEESARKINDWITEKTHEMITQTIQPEDITEDLGAALINTVYMESAWKEEWSISSDRSVSFTNLDGGTSGAEMLIGAADEYFENDEASAFGKYYRNGLEFVGILPKHEGDFKLQSLDLEGLLETGTSSGVISARMPKLDFSTNVDLTDYLVSHGLGAVFREGCTDFSGMMEGDGDALYVSKVIQSTKLELDDQGTRAAAVTAVMALSAALQADEEEFHEVHLDRPFAFLIYDSVNDVVIFAGKVVHLD